MKLFYRSIGSGPPLIILHGLFGQSDNWLTIARRIAERYTVFLPDMRNHGQSPHAPVHSYPAMSDDLWEFMEDLSIVDPVLIGHSMGGKTAMTFALEHPGKVQKLVIIDISPRKYPERNIHTQVITQMMSLELDELGTRTEVEKVLEKKVPDTRIRMFILKNLYYKTPGKLGWRLNLEAINNNLDQLFDGIHSNARYSGPTLFVRGGNSDYIVDEDIPLIRSCFPDSVIQTIPGASHWVHADAPGPLCSVLGNFLGKECPYPASP